MKTVATTSVGELDLARLRQSLPYPVGLGLRQESDFELPPLYDEEEALLSPQVSGKRRHYFRLGRLAAHDALADLGVAVGPVGRGRSGEPLWPRGLLGSISHSGGTAVAVVGHSRFYRGLGIDLETVEQEGAKAARLVCSRQELGWSLDADPRAGESWQVRQTLLFSAKESVFKALFALGQGPVSLLDIQLVWSAPRDAFVATPAPRAKALVAVSAMSVVHRQVIGTRVLTWTWLGQW